MMQTRQRGLTLVELMVVVAVMAIIATIAYPIYTNQVQKSRRADAKVALYGHGTGALLHDQRLTRRPGAHCRYRPKSRVGV